MLERLARRAGLEPLRDGEVDVPFEAPDPDTLVRALSSPGSVLPAIEHAGEAAVREAIVGAAAPADPGQGTRGA